MLWITVALVTSYFLGSIPTAYIFGRILKGVDIRKVGSGNIGATNAMRALGKGPGITVLLLDILKGFIVVSFLGDYFADRTILWQVQNLRIIMGLCCICGHNWTIFLKFKGGKGIATTFGVLLGLALKLPGLGIIIGILVLIWVTVFMIWRIVSLASIAAAIALPVCTLFFKQPAILVIVSVILCVFVIIRHKSNILRIAQSKEPRLYFKKPTN
ncbi:MAG: glycerol-3-phosphate 1-O-acyltransferase PlsY [Candidatus Omnitrophica bacterium]|nr:glycerol-3-phosphate 1-O-acyltransferase PlsY [Candidatus Omnitrophota bacterium]MBU1923083.1 glycerol-3-phosphate 1-O-acyltransferase PlsY [Candidatus Omnitrophota bacterium]